MKTTLARIGVIGSLFFVLTSPALALEFEGWGPRVGISDDPDQGVFGVHFDFGGIARNVKFRPSFELGFGDDVDAFLANGLVAYQFETRTDVEPYVGGQAVIAVFDVERRRDDDTDTEIGVAAVGGVEMMLRGGNRFHVEIQIGFGDIHDAKLMGGWTFGRR